MTPKESRDLRLRIREEQARPTTGKWGRVDDTPGRGTGTVYIAWEPEERKYRGYWDAAPDGEPAPLENMPATRSISEAVTWGRERNSSRVLIRPEFDPLGTYWGGEGAKPESLAEAPDLPPL